MSTTKREERFPYFRGEAGDVITAEDRKRYPGSTDSAILGYKLIGGISTEILLRIGALRGVDTKGFRAIQALLPTEFLTPYWIMGHVELELNARGFPSQRERDAHGKYTEEEIVALAAHRDAQRSIHGTHT